jgi:hypothetical protein
LVCCSKKDLASLGKKGWISILNRAEFQLITFFAKKQRHYRCTVKRNAGKNRRKRDENIHYRHTCSSKYKMTE